MYLRRTSILKENYYKLCRKYGVPVSEISSRVQYLISVFERLRPYLDRDFEKKLVEGQLGDRIAEMYFVDSLLNNNFSLEYRGRKGLDIWIKNINGWGEFVCSHNNDEMEKKNVLGKVRTVDEDECILRIIKVINDKRKKILNDLKNDVLNENDHIILFISTAQLIDPYPMNIKGEICSYVRSVFPIGKVVMNYNLITKKSEIARNYEKFINVDGKMISHDLFLQEDYSIISAVVFSYQSIFQQYFNSEIPFKSGDDFIVVHNPLARNPIPIGLLNCWQEYVCKYEKGKSISLQDVVSRERN